MNTVASNTPRRLRVLMVEDNPADAELCLRELKKAGYEAYAEVVREAKDFSGKLAATEFDVVIADAALPSWNGLEALEALRRAGKSTPFLLLTGTMRDDEAMKWIDRGVDDYLLKSQMARVGISVRLVLERASFRNSGGRNPADPGAGFAALNPYAVLELAADGKVLNFNPPANELAKSLGRDHPRDLLPVDAPVIARTALASGHKRSGVEVSLGGRTLSCSFFPIAPASTVHCYVSDVTDRQRLEAQLRHSQKLESVGRLAAGIAHDFNNVLTVIQGHTGLLRSDPAVTPAMGESVQGIARAAERGTKLTSQLLAFSRRNVLHLSAVDLNEVLTNLSSLVHRTLGEDITYQFDYASDLPPIHADRGLIEQVFMNLAVNARDAMPRGGQLVVTTSIADIDSVYVERHPGEAREGRFVCLGISDTGCGMDHVTLGRMFEPFFTTKEFGKGTGLGLATVYGIVKQHQGWIEVRSQLGQGTTFKVFLPPGTGPLASAPVAERSPESLRGTETILVVEDEPPVRWIVKDVLGKYGYKVLEAGSGVEALALWHQHQNEIQLLLTDMVMPTGLGGQELAEKFTSQKPELKVIFISGYSLQVAGRGFSVMDNLNFLQKPFDGSKLASAVRQCLDS